MSLNQESALFETTFPQHLSLIIEGQCRAILGKYSDLWLEDAVGETRLRYWKATQSGKFYEIKNHGSYISTIAQHVCFDILKPYKNILPLSEHEDFINAREEFVTVDDKIDLIKQFHVFNAIAPKNTHWNRRRKVLLCLMTDVVENREIARKLKVEDSVVSKDKNQIREFIVKTEELYGKLMRKLTERQQKILFYTARGYNGKNIAKELRISQALVTKELRVIRELLYKGRGNGGRHE